MNLKTPKRFGSWFMPRVVSKAWRTRARSSTTRTSTHNIESITPLIASIYVVYGKPFKQNRIIGELPDNIVPAKYRELHDNILKHCDQLYAHTDAKAFQVPDVGEANQVRFVVASGRMQLFNMRFTAGLLLLPDIVDLCRSLQEKMDYHIVKLWKRHIKKVPSLVGEYTLNVLDESGPFVRKETRTISISDRISVSRQVIHSL